jgi:succinate dehydrogenase / fumarate reductase iron-sulfur subunit
VPAIASKRALASAYRLAQFSNCIIAPSGVLESSNFNQTLQCAGWVGHFQESGVLMCRDALPVIRDLAGDRSAFDRIVQAGGFVSVSAGSAPDASLAPAAKIAHLRRMPQGRQEQPSRAPAMVDQMEAEGFGGCTNASDCEAACPKVSSVDMISEVTADHFRATLKGA